MIMTRLKIASIAFVAMGMAACGPLIELPGSGSAPSHFSLNVPSGDGAGSFSSDWKIFMDEPRVPGMLRLDRIAVKSGERTSEYLADARWADRTPELLQGYWVRLLEEQGFKNVFGGDDIEILTDHNVRVTVHLFQAEVDGAEVLGHVRVHVVLLKNRPVEPIARKTFDATARAMGNDQEVIVAAINDALDEVSMQMIQWLKAESPAPKG